MDQAPLRVLHIVSAKRWRSEDATPARLITALRTQTGIPNHVVLVGDEARDPALPGGDITVISHHAQSLVRRVRALEHAVAATRPDIVHTYGFGESLIGAYVVSRARCTMLRTVESEAVPGRAWQHRLLHAADDLCERMHLNVVCNSPEAGAQIARRHRRLCVSVIEPGVDVRALHAQAVQPAAMGDLGAGFHIGFVGPLTPDKRLDMALATAWVLGRDHPDRFRFHVFGEGESRAACEAFAERHGLAASVTFHGERVPLIPALARMNALLWCADHGGVPTRVIEALMLGVPVVAHATGGLSQLLGFGAYGTLVHEHAPYAYAAALAAMATHPEQIRQRTAAAAHHARGHYDMVRVARRYAMLYHALSAGRHKHSLGVCYL